MRAASSSAKVCLRDKAASVVYFLICSLTIVSTGCKHKIPVGKRVFSLEGPPEFPIMVPSSSTSTTGDDFQEYPLEITGKEASTGPPRAGNCTVKGTFFSLAPAKSSNSNLWVIT